MKPAVLARMAPTGIFLGRWTPDLDDGARG
jgi:hypothetical protein